MLKLKQWYQRRVLFFFFFFFFLRLNHSSDKQNKESKEHQGGDNKGHVRAGSRLVAEHAGPRGQRRAREGGQQTALVLLAVEARRDRERGVLGAQAAPLAAVELGPHVVAVALDAVPVGVEYHQLLAVHAPEPVHALLRKWFAAWRLVREDRHPSCNVKVSLWKALRGIVEGFILDGDFVTLRSIPVTEPLEKAKLPEKFGFAVRANVVRVEVPQHVLVRFATVHFEVVVVAHLILEAANNDVVIPPRTLR
eukprot:TRINITY_DN598_c0_g3_i3.p1 TRINITY_DN598_c0_g3~~TRINITY_DN598_c0_g3_i3.p1  ORF type:complete len:251 (+),score=39.76 TRINITY_DN598_c0_g3_i3:75-827(+)